jgi:FlaA1/EpsC-like NDP-sugar epimerase
MGENRAGFYVISSDATRQPEACVMNYAELLDRPICDPEISLESLTCDAASRFARWDPGGEGCPVMFLIADKTGLPPLVSQIRRPMKLDRVLITGACGTIGSAIINKLRGVAGRICAADRDERSLAAMDDSDGVQPCLLDVRDRQEVAQRVHFWQPQLIIHCAAYKHVPLMELHVKQCMENNFNGTMNVVDACRISVPDSRFVFVSTDKAATCRTIMGRSKRAAEDYIKACQSSSERTYSIVRFGNVLGSSGSVIEIWERQLAEGVPLTVTENASRYFCTIDEAAAFAIMASIFVWGEDDNPMTPVLTLGMDKPIELMELAKRFLKFKGVPEYDVEIMAARNGDQPTEQLAGLGEEMQKVEVANA